MIGLLIVGLGVSVGLGIVAFVAMRYIPESTLRKVETQANIVTPILSLILSTSIAIFAVALAFYSAEIANRQNQRQLYERIQDEADEMNRIYTNLSVALSRVLQSGFEILGTIRSMDDSLLEDPSEINKPFIQSKIGHFIDALTELEHALDQVQSDPTSNRLLNSGLDKSESALAYVADRSKQWSIPHMEDLANFDLATLRYYLHNSRESLRVDPFSTVARAYATILLTGGNTHQNPARPGSITWVAFTGYLILVTEHQSETGDYYIYSSGLALLHDLAMSLPKANDIRDAIGSEDMDVVLDFDPSVTLGVRFAEGLYDPGNWRSTTGERFDLVFMESPVPYSLMPVSPN